MHRLLKKHKEVIILLLLVCLAYSNCLFNGFVSDDIPSIPQNSQIGSLNHALAQFPYFLRPLLHYIITHLLGGSPVFYRLPNIFFHAATVLVTYFLVSRLSSLRVAFIAASLLAVHPVCTEAVAWISAGPYAQYSFFFMLSLLFYAKSLGNPVYFLPSVFSFALSIISSEKAVVFPLILALFIICFSDIRKRYKDIIPFAIIGLILAVFLFFKLGERINVLQTEFNNRSVSLNPLLQIPFVITSYLGLIFWPVKLTLYHCQPYISRGEYGLRLLVFILFLGLMCLSLRRHRQVFFWLAFFFIGLLPVMTPWGISWLVAERYVYLSAIGIFVVIGLVFDTLGQSRILRLCSNIVFSLLLIFLTARTILRNLDWVNEDSLWFATTRVSPASPNAHNNLGDVYSRQGELEKAAEEFRQAIKIDPGYAEAHHNLAVTYRLMGRAQDAIKGYLTAITLNPRLWQSYENLAGIYFDLGNFRMAKALLLKATEINPGDANLHVNLAVACYKLGETEKAKEQLLKAFALEPANRRAAELLKDIK